jgi:nucleoside-diphosphate-sugar epimerase
MKVLVVGGSGIVGALITPFLAEAHTLRIFDLTPPQQIITTIFKGMSPNMMILLRLHPV